MTMPAYDLTTILEDLAAGRIDAGEAARRIDAVSARHASSPNAGDSAPAPGTGAAEGTDRSAANGGKADPDAWAVSTDRPQRAGHPRERVAGTTEHGTDAGTGADAGTDAGADAGASSRTGGETGSGAGDAPVGQRTSRASRPSRPAGAVDRVSVRAVGRRVRIVGEHSVATVAVDGPHVLRRNGSVMEISSDGEIGASIDGFQLLRGAPRSLEDFRAIGLGKELYIRVNPGVVVDVEVTAGSLHTERVPLLGKVRVTAGGAKLLDVEEISDALVQAGQATVRGTLREGRSRVRAESGSLVLQLGDRSDVTIHSDAQLGKVTWSGIHSGAGDEVVMGSGQARLEVGVVMGYAQVQAGSAATSGAR